MFMKPVFEFGGAWIIETMAGTEVIPDDLVNFDPSLVEDDDDIEDYLLATFGDYLESRPYPNEVPEHRTGVLYRLSAPGYLDCTPWGIADTVEEARQELSDAYGIEFDDDGEVVEDED